MLGFVVVLVVMEIMKILDEVLSLEFEGVYSK